MDLRLETLLPNPSLLLQHVPRLLWVKLRRVVDCPDRLLGLPLRESGGLLYFAAAPFSGAVYLYAEFFTPPRVRPILRGKETMCCIKRLSSKP